MSAGPFPTRKAAFTVTDAESDPTGIDKVLEVPSLAELVDGVLAIDEIKQAAEMYNTDLDAVKEHVLQQAPALWDLVAEQRKRFEQARTPLIDAKGRIGTAAPLRRYQKLNLAAWIALALGVVLCMAGTNVLDEGSTELNVLIWSCLGLIAIFILWRSNRVDLLRDFGDRARKSVVPEADLISYAEARDALRASLVRDVLLPEVRSAVNEQLDQQFGPDLHIGDTPGLAEVFRTDFLVRTSSFRVLSRQLAVLPGGTLGISGSRGSGKTTLMRHYCRSVRARDVTDPVRLSQPRTSVTSRRVRSEVTSPTLGVLVSAPVGYEPRDFLLHLLSTLCNEVLSLEGPPDQSSSRRHRIGQWFAFAALLVGVVCLMVSIRAVHDRVTLIGRVASEASADWLRQWLLLGSPTLWIAVVSGSAGILAVALIGVTRWHKRWSEPAAPSLSQLAADLRDEIRYQRTVVAEKSGGLRLTAGFELAAKHSQQLARVPLNYPELVAEFRTFTSTVAKDYQVFIGIDELDKMGSSEIALRFLNDIKSIFGLDRCYYLISVADDALNTFRARGIAYRDALDSTFDDIMTVPQLTFEEGSDLLRRRAIGLTVPATVLCFALSGGLPRELIRSARAVADLTSHPAKVADVAAALIFREVGFRMDVLAALLQRSGAVSRALTNALAWPGPAGTDTTRLVADLRTRCDLLLDAYTKVQVAGGEPLDGTSLAARLVGLLASLSISLTVAELFGLRHDKWSWQRLAGADDAGIDSFARAHRVLHLDPWQSYAEVSAFRKQWFLTALTELP